MVYYFIAANLIFGVMALSFGAWRLRKEIAKNKDLQRIFGEALLEQQMATQQAVKAQIGFLQSKERVEGTLEQWRKILRESLETNRLQEDFARKYTWKITSATHDLNNVIFFNKNHE